VIRYHKAPKDEGDQGIVGKRSGERKKCGQQDTSTAGGRWRWQDKTELDGDRSELENGPKKPRFFRFIKKT